MDGPAFPVPDDAIDFPGMTLRAYAAIHAAQGICSSKDEAGVLIQHGYEWIARESVAIADALMKELAK